MNGFEVLTGEESEFFAPASSDLVDGLIGEYQARRKRIENVASFVQSPDTLDAVHYFLEGNRTEERGRMALSLSAAQLFNLEGAVAALNSAYWSKALQLTDVLDTMPQKRRSEWHEQISGHKAPDFEEETVRATLTDLLNSRSKFFAERVDGIFRGLSGEHVTNAPEGFGKRMIIARVLNYHGTSDHTTCGLINDLRCVIAKFMGRDEPRYWASSELVRQLQGNWGQWVTIDGGSLRIRLYKKGTAHMEVHPDIAWRLNQVLAHLHPMAIPAQFRQKPKRRVKDFAMVQRPLPFAVLEILSGMREARERVGEWPERYRTVPNTYSIGYQDRGKHVAAEAEQVLRCLGGVPHPDRSGWWTFDYRAGPVIDEVVTSGCLPDQKAHQFYPTPRGLAERVVELAAIGPDHIVLEPSAGTGGLADLLPKDRTQCVEISKLHCKVLEAKGFTAAACDFLTFDGSALRGAFDRVVMNPPFSEGRWRAHLEHAAAMVRPGGRLVAVLPSGAKGVDLPGFDGNQWHGPLSGQFPGTSVDVVLLVANKIAA